MDANRVTRDSGTTRHWIARHWAAWALCRQVLRHPAFCVAIVLLPPPPPNPSLNLNCKEVCFSYTKKLISKLDDNIISVSDRQVYG
jgi:hypothetical protein